MCQIASSLARARICKQSGLHVTDMHVTDRHRCDGDRDNRAQTHAGMSMLLAKHFTSTAAGLQKQETLLSQRGRATASVCS